MDITLQTMMKRVKNIDRLINDEFDLKGAETEAMQLCREGERVTVSEWNQQTLVKEIVSPVVVELGKVLSSETIQHQFPLLLALSKTYRVFIELTWSQCLFKIGKPIPAYAETRKTILENAQKLISVLPKGEESEMKFELRCAQQAAKWLVPNEGMWMRLVNHVIKFTGSMAQSDAAGCWQAVREFASGFDQEWMKSWYLDIYELRRDAMQVTTVGSFDACIGPKIDNCIEKGGKHSECLTIIFMQIIENPEVDDQDVKWRAFQGDRAQRGLIHLVECRQIDLGNKISRFFAKKFKKIAEQADRFRKTRNLAMQYLVRLATKEEHSKYRDTSIESLYCYQKGLSKRRKSKYEEEKRQLTEMITSEVQQLKSKQAASEEEAKTIDEEISKRYQKFRGRTSGANEEAEIKEFIAESKVVKDRIEELKQEQEQAQSHLEQVESDLAASLQSQDEAEAAHLEQVLRSLNR